MLQIPEPDGKKIVAEIAEAVEKTGFVDCAVKVCVVSGGDCAQFFAKPDSFQAVISVREITEKPPRQNGIKIICPENRYLRNSSALSGIKSLNYLENIVAMREARRSGFDDALFLDSNGFVAETSCCNIFWGSGNRISTPSLCCGVLPGITRGVLMDLGRQNDFTMSEECRPPRSMKRADFAFVTNSLMGITPVDKIQVQDLTLTFETSYTDSYVKLKSLLYQSLIWN